MGINEGFFGNILHRSNPLKKGDEPYVGEPHDFDHTTFVTQGTVRITHRKPDGSEVVEVVSAPGFTQIHAKDTHVFEALEDECHWWCMFVVRGLDGQPLNPDIDLRHV